jgi:transcriptional regulator with XRE-family HTH domain
MIGVWSMRICEHCFGTGDKLDPRVLAKHARGLRAYSGISQPEMARRLGISTAQLCRLERGNRNWSWKMWTRLHKLAGQPLPGDPDGRGSHEYASRIRKSTD